MSADLTQRIVEAGARAIVEQYGNPCGDCNYAHRCTGICSDAMDFARACLSAAHALAEQEGVIFTRVPGLEVDYSELLGIAYCTDEEQEAHERGYEIGVGAGYNAHRAATLAAKVTL